ncbi:DapH/DapD/GlmU-related protein [Shewanella algae]|uniref:DapH/DapD/GlmU-related protein n=1 Tax=Shewanella algae TaxID=38313 RepID=UPI001183416D|nr:DapH/DapD/GlmU-related protein [Shewanella algae]
MKGYGFFESVSLAVSLVRTRLCFKNARLIRFPISIRNKNNIKLGVGFTTGKYCRIDAFPMEEDCGHMITFGENCQINDSVHIAAVKSITFGNNVLIASRVFITDHNHGTYIGEEQSLPSSVVAQRELSSASVEIGDNVWLGEGVAIMPGTRIGNNSVVAANSVVTKSVPPNVIVAGTPAKPIKMYDENSKKWIAVKGSL